MGNSENLSEVIMTIKKQFAESIFSGEKLWEIRKHAPGLKPPYKVYVAVSGTNGTIFGEFVVDKVQKLAPAKVQDSLLRECGVERDFLRSYAGSSTELTFLHISQPKRYFLVDSGPTNICQFGLKRAPQSWQYVRKESKL